MTHGIDRSYHKGCRCDECRKAHNLHNQAYRKLHPRTCIRCPQPAEWKSKYCTACKEVRKAERREAGKLRSREERLDPVRNAKILLTVAAYQARHPDRIRESGKRTRAKRKPHLRLYGLSKIAFETMVAQQNFCCAICGRKRKLGVDHDHLTGNVRALLCGSCNRGLGLFGESVERLAQAIIYLERFTNAHDQGNLGLA